ncbi:MAG TPA: glycosyltransferase family 2 protein [Bryobacteraceae bacterium]|jgi:glycosyltransferase involved in cell wall biosynthesis|nr:glycosyltransferase family 2 protein [Bryobacteraceae bacterium]
MISVVVPAFNEEEGIETLYQRVTDASAAWGEDHELIIVDDGSRDRTLQICERLASADSRLKILSLSRNFGHQAAVTAGLQHAAGDIVAVMDADLQDPPEELLPFIEKVRSGFDVVYAIRTKRKEGLLKRISYHLYYRILRKLATLDIPLDAGDFCVMRGEVVEAMNQLPERNRFVRGLRTWIGYRQTGLAYERAARFAGEPKYTFSRLVKLGLDGIINFSYRPLQIITYVGLMVALAAIVLGVAVFFLYASNATIWGFNPRQSRGWTSLILVLLFSSAVQMISLGILGEYIGRLFEETKRRPIYLLKKRVNCEAAVDTRHLT